MSHTLYGITSADLAVFLVMLPILALASLLAVFGPVRRASAADPMLAPRAD
ncbi:MAG TPA: hypothetical protein VN706_08600 [Gemmatimonadaceae bacterium]|nr:hypothetical protein [Gemmatimonadaceae bacterium]